MFPDSAVERLILPAKLQGNTDSRGSRTVHPVKRFGTRWRCWLGIVSLLGLTACATTSVSQQAAAPARVLQSVQDVPFAVLPLGQADSIDMQTANILQDGNQRRFVKGFKIPADKKPLSLRIGSYRMGTALEPVIFYPEVRIFNSHYRLVRTLPHTAFVYRATSDGSGLFTTVFFNRNNQDETYVLVSNREPDAASLNISQDNISSAAVVGVPIGPMLFFWVVPTGSSSKPVRMRAAQTGTIEVEMDKYQPKIVGTD